MKKIITFILVAICLASCESAYDEFGRDKRFEYNIQAVLIEKFSDTDYHFVCQDVKDGRMFTYDWDSDDFGAQEGRLRYNKRKVGDTCFFEFINKTRFKDKSSDESVKD